MGLTYNEYLLTCLAEEAAEVIQRVEKAKRFGMDEVQEGFTENNAERLAGEIEDFLGVLKMIEARQELVIDRSDERMERKQERVIKYSLVSFKRGILTEAPCRVPKET